MARNMTNTNWTETLFVSNKKGDQTFVTVPKNIEDFRDSLMMMSILKAYELKQWIPSLSSVELPKAVLDTKEGAFFAGFVAAATCEQTGQLHDASTKYGRGIRAFQLFSVEKKVGKLRHLKTGGMEALTERLSNMKGFTQMYWGMRGSLVTLFKSLKPVKATDLKTYVKSKEELLKTVKTRLHYENGGCYRPEELTYLADRYQSQKGGLNAFIARLERPDESLAERFEEIYAPVKTMVETADNEIKANLAARSRILFPNDNRKQTQTWIRKPLSEKLAGLSDEKLKEFLPETLPGIIAKPVPISGDVRKRNSLLGHRYDTVKDELAMGVVTSWYANFDSSLSEETES
jgi:hypothetical protein